MLITHQLLLILLINMRVQCARVAVKKNGIGPVQLRMNTGPQVSGTFNETLNLHGERESSVSDSGFPEVSSPPLRDIMDIYPSRYPEDHMVSDSLEGENIELGYASFELEEIMIPNFIETAEQDFFAFPSAQAVAMASFDPQPSEAPDFDSLLPSSDLGLQQFEEPGFGILPTRSPASFTGIGISTSTAGSSPILSGQTTHSRVAGITVTAIVVFGTIVSVLAIVLYGRNINPYRPFITGASLSEESFGFAPKTASEMPSAVYNSEESKSQSRRYEATSLNRDIEPAQRLEAAKLLEDIPDRHCR